MDCAPSLESVLQALQTLYHSPDNSAKEKASAWLADLQTSVFAWSLSDQLLASAQDLESCYFAAQTMRTKIQHHFYELPPTSHQSLRDSLLGHMCKCDSGTNQTVVTQLCLALGDLALQMASWKDAVRDLLQQFGSDARMSGVLLDILTVIPEEVSSRSLRLGSNRRKELTNQLRQNFPAVHEFLLAYAASAQHDAKKLVKVFKCLESWFYAEAVQEDVIVGSQLLVAIFQILNDKNGHPPLVEAAADCLSSALRVAEDVKAYTMLPHYLLDGTLQLLPAYGAAVAEEDLDRCMSYCRIFSDMAESFLQQIVNHPGEGLGTLRQLDVVLACGESNQYEVADITFNFWYRLSDVLFEKNDRHCTSCFAPYVQRLIMLLCRHCQLDADMDGVLSSTDDFYDFRSRANELVKDIVYIVGSSSCFAQIYEALKAAGSSQWNTTESLLFILTAFAKNIPPDDGGVVPSVLQAVLGLPGSAHPALLHTSTQLIGELAEWIDLHPQFLDAALQFLLGCLHAEPLAPSAAAAIDSICTSCSTRLAPHFGVLYQVVEAASDKLKLSHDAIAKLLKGTSVVLSKMPNEDITTGLRKLCALQVEPLRKLTASVGSAASPSKAVRVDAGALLDRLSAVLRHVTSDAGGPDLVVEPSRHPCFAVVQELWPTLSAACRAYQADIRTTEKCCRCVRFALRCLGLSFTPLLADLVALLVPLYAQHLHSCYLYLASILVDVYGTQAACVDGLLAMASALAAPTFEALAAASARGRLRDHPDLIDDFFRLMLRFVQRAPLAVLRAPFARPLFQCGVTACTLNHREANASVTRFLVELLRCAQEGEERPDFKTRQAAVLELTTADGGLLVQTVINCVVRGLLPSHMLDDVSEVFYNLMVLDRQAVRVWLAECLKQVPSQTSGGVITVTQQQMEDFHSTVTRAECWQDVKTGLDEFMRLYK